MRMAGWYLQEARRVDGRLQAVWKSARQAVVPRSAIGIAGVLAGGLLWLPLYGLWVSLSAGVRGLVWEDAGIDGALGAAYAVAAALGTFTSEAGLPVLVGVSLGGVGLVLGWAATVRTGQWAAGSAAALLATPMLHLLCWAQAAFSEFGWLFDLGVCLGMGFVFSLPVWAVLWWATDLRVRRRTGLLVPGIAMGLAVLSCGLAEWLMRQAAELVSAGAWQ